MSRDHRYRLTLVGLGAATLLVAGAVGGTVVLSTRNETLGAAVIVLVAIGGWSLGRRLRDHHRLGLPLWGHLPGEQSVEPRDLREYRRTGKVREPRPRQG